MNQGQVLAQAFDSSWGVSSVALAKVGILNPDQANRFIDYVVDQSVLSKVATVKKMNSQSARFGRVAVGSKVLRPATRGTDPGATATASITEVTLQTKEMIAEAVIFDDELEDNTEGQDFADHFMRMLAEQIANQLELAYLTGRPSSTQSQTATDINQLIYGWYPATVDSGHKVDGSVANALWSDNYISTTKISKLIKSVPSKYRSNKRRLRLLGSPDLYQDFIDLIGNRTTPYGDQAFKAGGYETNFPDGDSVLGYGAIPFFTVPLLPETLFCAKASSPASATVASGGASGTATLTLSAASTFANGDTVQIGTGAVAEVGTIASGGGTTSITLAANLVYNHVGDAVTNGTADRTFLMVTHVDNFVVGIQRDIRIEMERRARERATYAVVTIRSDAALMNPDSAAVLNNLAIK